MKKQFKSNSYLVSTDGPFHNHASEGLFAIIW